MADEGWRYLVRCDGYQTQRQTLAEAREIAIEFDGIVYDLRVERPPFDPEFDVDDSIESS